MAPLLTSAGWVYVALGANCMIGTDLSFGLPAVVHLTLILGVLLTAVLIIVVVWLKRRINKNNSTTQHHLGLTSHGVVGPSDAAPSNQEKAERGADPASAQDAPPAPQVPKYRDDATISKHMKIAELANDQESLATLYLERARFDLSNDDTVGAGGHLRKSVMLATSHNLKRIHAEARLELADISESAGDMTTACEHWQMARGLFHELDAQDAIKQTDTRMLSNGCPTDWVLTDF